MKGEDQSVFMIPVDFRFSTMLCNIALHDYEVVVENSPKDYYLNEYLNIRYSHGKICNRCKKIKLYDSMTGTWKTTKEVNDEK